MSILEATAAPLLKSNIEDVKHGTKMHSIVENNCNFLTYSSAFYATGINFQQSNRPTSTYDDMKAWYSGKHVIYKYKQNSLFCGFCRNYTLHEQGTISNITIFKNSFVGIVKP